MSSLYNLMNGYSSACIFFLPMLGRKPEEYPRFRDCFLTEDGKGIAIYTRVGGNNRNCGYGEEKLYEDENFIQTYDDEFDNTYATYEFKVPEKWQSDFNKIINKDFKNVSQEYIETIKNFYPTLTEQGIIDKIFCKNSDGEEVK